MDNDINTGDTVTIPDHLSIKLAASLWPTLTDDLELVLRAPVRFGLRDDVITNLESLVFDAVKKQA